MEGFQSGLSYDDLVRIVDGAASIASKSSLTPATGAGTAIAPPTVEGGRILETRLPDSTNPSGYNLRVEVASEAAVFNLVENAWYQAMRNRGLRLPDIRVSTKGIQAIEEERVPDIEMNTLLFNARIYDTYFRNSNYTDENGESKPFFEHPIMSRVDRLSIDDMTPLFEICPTGIVGGVWGSSRTSGGNGNKFGRVFSGHIFATGAKRINHSSRTKRDPHNVSKNHVISKDQNGRISYCGASKGAKAEPENGNGNGKGKKGKKKAAPGAPSTAGFGSLPGEIISKKIIATNIELAMEISLNQLRKCRFPTEESRKSSQRALSEVDKQRDIAARALIAALALYGVALVDEVEGYHLRSCCNLVRAEDSSLHWTVRWLPSDDNKTTFREFSLSVRKAQALFEEAYQHALNCGLVWRYCDEPFITNISEEALKLLNKHYEDMCDGSQSEDASPAKADAASEVAATVDAE